jgi:uncharacterized OB-fold protein
VRSREPGEEPLERRDGVAQEGIGDAGGRLCANRVPVPRDVLDGDPAGDTGDADPDRPPAAGELPEPLGGHSRLRIHTCRDLVGGQIADAPQQIHGELRLQKCATCSHVYFPPRPFCPQCSSRDVGVVRASGRATLYSYVIHHRPAPGFAPPYSIAVVQLEEGPRMMTNIVDIEQTPDFGASLDTAYILGLAKVRNVVKSLLDLDKIVAAETATQLPNRAGA